MKNDLKIIQKELFEEYKKNGYLDMWNMSDDIAINDIAELGLITTEVSEAMEEIRNHPTNWSKVAEECADIIIRTINFMTRKHINVIEALNKAHRKNLKREHRHGRKI